MGTKIIPEQKITTCDCCSRVLDRGNWRKEGKLIIRQHALDMQGSACADASVSLDLCDNCLYIVSKSVNDGVAAARAAQAQGGANG